MKILLIGAVFDTGNLGVSALAESSIKVIVRRWPSAEIKIFGGQREACRYDLDIMGRRMSVELLPLRYSKNIFLPNHFFVLFLASLLVRIFPFRRLRDFLASRNKYLKAIFDADLAVDITGGDSFSDIYGLYRFMYILLPKLLIIRFRKKLVMLPQTYGPFNGRLSRTLSRYVLRRASIVHSRDRAGTECVRALLGPRPSANGEKIRFTPDVAFVLDPVEPAAEQSAFVQNVRAKSTTLVGLNVSGLLFNSAASQSRFGLKCPYPSSVGSIVGRLLEKPDVTVLLVPHVFPYRGDDSESDVKACTAVYDSTGAAQRARLVNLRDKYSHNEAKHIIGQCDFFIGSRMHSCIAAMSQGVPTVGVAYSQKFHGVFETVDMSGCVADARSLDERELAEKVDSLFLERARISKDLQNRIPRLKQDIFDIFKDANGS